MFDRLDNSRFEAEERFQPDFLPGKQTSLVSRLGICVNFVATAENEAYALTPLCNEDESNRARPSNTSLRSIAGRSFEMKEGKIQIPEPLRLNRQGLDGFGPASGGQKQTFFPFLKAIPVY